MCRLIVYKGKDSMLIADLITRPAHSIIAQSYDCKLRIDLTRPLNGDGFGLGWYEDNASAPCIFTSVLPAWNNMNLHRLAEKLRTPLLFAHVRASTGGTPASETNCHPWQYKNLMWMHNGHIAEFSKIKRSLQNQLQEKFFLHVQGNTDSEWAFALFLNQLKDSDKIKFEPFELRDAMLETIHILGQLSHSNGVQSPSLLNFCVTDGHSIVCTRFNSSPEHPPASLFWSSGSRFECIEPGRYKMIKTDKRENLVVVASEPLTFEENDWLPIPINQLMLVTPRLNLLFYPIPFYKDQCNVNSD